MYEDSIILLLTVFFILLLLYLGGSHNYPISLRVRLIGIGEFIRKTAPERETGFIIKKGALIEGKEH